MLLVTFEHAGDTRIGVLDSAKAKVLDVSAQDPGLPRDMMALIAEDGAMARLRRRLDTGDVASLPLDAVRLRPPIPHPARNILCIGKNYRAHVKEIASLPAGGPDTPEYPIVFTKAPSTVIGPGEPIPSWLDPTATTDYEGELGVIIGRGGRAIPRAQAMSHVFGYTILNDVTSRALQKRHAQWFLGKSIDGFCPLGPAILTADAVPDVWALCIETRVNGELRQSGCVRDMIFDIPALIETLSAGMTLLAGDIIATGTPAGVGAGFSPPRFLRPGDVVSIRIAPIGVLENPVE